ncbi:MAG: hypothetical protein ABIV50_13900 [Opitutus sp.]
MTIDPLSAHSSDPAPLPEAPPSVSRSARRVSVTAQGSEGTEVITGMVMDASAPTSTSPGYVKIYDVKNQQVVIKSPAPQNLASA